MWYAPVVGTPVDIGTTRITNTPLIRHTVVITITDFTISTTTHTGSTHTSSTILFITDYTGSTHTTFTCA